MFTVHIRQRLPPHIILPLGIFHPFFFYFFYDYLFIYFSHPFSGSRPFQLFSDPKRRHLSRSPYRPAGRVISLPFYTSCRYIIFGVGLRRQQKITTEIDIYVRSYLNIRHDRHSSANYCLHYNMILSSSRYISQQRFFFSFFSRTLLQTTFKLVNVYLIDTLIDL